MKQVTKIFTKDLLHPITRNIAGTTDITKMRIMNPRIVRLNLKSLKNIFFSISAAILIFLFFFFAFVNFRFTKIRDLATMIKFLWEMHVHLNTLISLLRMYDMLDECMYIVCSRV